jgi:short-subunit dehydrogenase
MRAMFATNVFGTIDCIRAAVPVMEKQEPSSGRWRGQVMIVSSAAGRRGLPYFGTYSATKYAQLAYAEALRIELQPKGIAVTSVHPVGTKTAFFDVAEQQGGTRLPWDSNYTSRQSAETVAARMVRGIARPVPEVWPMEAARFAMGMGTMVPGIVDAVMTGAFRKIEKSK